MSWYPYLIIVTPCSPLTYFPVRCILLVALAHFLNRVVVTDPITERAQGLLGVTRGVNVAFIRTKDSP